MDFCPKIIQLPKVIDKRGNLSFFENNNQIPFVIRRVYWVYDVPGGESQDGCVFKATEEFLIALSGSFDIVLDDGTRKMVFNMTRSYYGLYIPKMYWREVNNFSTNSLALIVSSMEYDEDDYISDYSYFCALKSGYDKINSI